MTNKQAFYKDLRKQWKVSKDLAGKDQTTLAMWRESGGNISYHGFFFVYQQMRALGLKGLPYVDAKTFKKWKESGFKVKRGEKSTIMGLVWKHPAYKDQETGEYIEDTERLFPKVYHLFHSSQVEAIGKEADKLEDKEKPADTSAEEIKQPVALF